MKHDQITGFKGLFLQPNSYEVPKGALEVAENVNIEDKDVIRKCRGFYKYHENLDDNEIVGITSFDNHLIATYLNKLVYYSNVLPQSPNETGTQVDIVEDTPVDVSYSVVDNPVYEQVNGNLYTTCDQGILKLTDYNATLYQAGAPQALDLEGDFSIGTSATWWNINEESPGSKTVAYRIVFGYEDANNNLILGAPSGYFTISNPSVLDKTTGVLGTVITVTSNNHGLTNGMQLYFFDASSGFTTPGNAEGPYVITYINANQFSYTVTTTPGPGAGTISYCYAMATRLEFTIPSQISTNINTGWFYQVYRSSQVPITSTIQSDFQLIVQNFLTQTELDNHVAFFNDDKSEFFKGAPLYTNQNSGEGELQANFRPPQCQSLALYQKYLFFGNCRTRHLLNFAVVDPTKFTTSSYIEIKVGDNVRRYFVGSETANLTLRASVTATTPMTVTTAANHGIPAFGLNTVYLDDTTITIGGLPINGVYYAINVTATTFEVTDTIGGAALNCSATGAIDFQSLYQSQPTVAGVSWARTTNVVTITSAAHGLLEGMQVYISVSAGGSPDIITGIYVITGAPTIDTFTFEEVAADSSGTCSYNSINYVFYDNNTSGVISVQIRDSAESLVKAINRDPLSLVYAQYTSTPIDTPGNIRIQEKNFGEPIYLRVNPGPTATPPGPDTQAGFFPQIPTSYTGPDQVYSADEILLNAVFFSKLQEPEAVPLVNFISVGSEKAQILNIYSLTNSLVILKEDGVYRLTGDNPSNFVVAALDNTVNSVARRGSTTFANQVAALTNQGIVLINETSVQIISRVIENVIQTIVNNGTIDIDTAAVAYEIDRNYIITTQTPDGQSQVTYCYNILTDSWTTWTWLFTYACVGPEKILYLVDTTRKIILRERKNNNKLDYVGQWYDVTVIDYIDSTHALISCAIEPQYGDIIVKSDIINIIRSSVEQNPGEYEVEFFYESNLADSDAVVLYQKYESTVKLAPYTSGNIGLGKQFTQMQIHFRDHACNALSINYSNDTYQQTTTDTEWESPIADENKTIDIEYTSNPSRICRVYVSRQAQRSTYIQPIIHNEIAGDRLNIQSVNLSVRTYGERVSI